MLTEGMFWLNYYLMCQTESNPENSYPQNSMKYILIFVREWKLYIV